MIKYCSECGIKYDRWTKKKTLYSRITPHNFCEDCTNKHAVEAEIKRLHDEYEKKTKAQGLVEEVKDNLSKIKAKDVARVNGSKRRALEKKASGKYTIKYIEYLLVKQCNKCIACLADIAKEYHVDHIYPLAKGGSNGDENIQLLCPPCNTKKNAQDPIHFLQKYKLRTYCDI
jgi:5-methylcytosine-specific restriction endonuclease McrA